MEQIIEIITTYGLETVVIALLINVLTGLVKLPIKKLAGKLDDYTKITRFIVFLPILFGFALTICYEKFILKSFGFNQEFFTLWLTSSSLSLTFYAIFEKIFPSKKKLLSDSEIKTSETILENIKALVEKFLPNDEINQTAETGGTVEEVVPDNVEPTQGNKIVLRGKSSVNVESKN